MRRSAPVLITAAVLGASLASATAVLPDVRRGPYPSTALSRGGELIWYTGILDLTGRRWGEMDAICRTVPVRQVSGWRAPTMVELETLMRRVPRDNGITTWIDLQLDSEAALAPAVAPFAFGARQHPQVNLLSRDLFTYDGRATIVDRVERGKMYVVHWFKRWTQPIFVRDRSIRHDPAERAIGGSDRLLCVSDHNR